MRPDALNIWSEKTTQHGFFPGGERNFQSTPNKVLTVHAEWLPCVQLRHSVPSCSTYRVLWGLVVVWWLYLTGQDTAWRLKPEVSWVRLLATAMQLFTFLYFVSKFPTIQQFRLSWQSIKSWPIIVQANSPLSMRLLIVITVPEIILNHIVLHTGKVMHSRTLGLRYLTTANDLNPFYSATLHFMHIIFFHRLNQNWC